jgi:hypothetical protein
VECVKEFARDLHALGEFEAARRLGEDTVGLARRVLGEARATTSVSLGRAVHVAHRPTRPPAAGRPVVAAPPRVGQCS